mmetsp:Transcript_129067/g.361141  ORF Transcript_129067/g.361141 Transcript_129067/m.361141 type:complete len:112 (-) Transcript_129067:427-762(-)
MQTALEAIAATLGASTIGSASIQPHKHQTMALKKLAVTSGPGMERLLLELSTAGTVTSMDNAPKKLQKDATSPERKSARSDGSTAKAEACSNTSEATAVKYVFKLPWACLY